MRAPVPAEDFARQVAMPVERVEEYRAAGLLDPDDDGLFDDFDILRATFLSVYESEGLGIDEVLAELDKPERRLTAERIFKLGAKTYTAADAAKSMGITIEQMEELATAMGFASDDSLLDESDMRGFAEGRRIIDSGIPWEGIIEGARVYSDVLRRLAQAEINMTHRFFCEPLAKAGTSETEISTRFHEVGEMLTQAAEGLILHMHEDFLLNALVDHALLHLEAGRAEKLPGTIEATILFVDLSLFTPLVQVHGDEIAADILDRFDQLVRKRSVRHGGTLVKQIGDAFMVNFSDQVEAVRFALGLLEDATAEKNFPALRIGIHSGPVLYRGGDFVGNTVNIASRVTTMAMPNVILMTEPVAVAARDAEIAIEELGVRNVRGVEEALAIYRLAPSRESSRDPVCGMVVGDHPAATITENGTIVAFCSQDCLRRFLAEPARYPISA